MVITHDLTGDFVGGFKNGQSIRMQFGMTVMDDDKNAPPIITDKAGTVVPPNGSVQIHLPDRPWRRGDDNYWIDVKLPYPEYATILLSNRMSVRPPDNPGPEGPFWLRQGQFTAWPQFDALRHVVMLRFTPQNWNVPQRVYIRMHCNVMQGTEDQLHVARQYSTWTYPIRYSFDLPGTVSNVKLPPTLTGDGRLIPYSVPGGDSGCVQEPNSPPVTSSSVVRISGVGAGPEGSPVSFGLRAEPAPAQSLDVSVTVSATGDYGVTTGTRTITIDSNGFGSVDIPTTGDEVDEPDGSVTLTINDGSGYTVDPPSRSTTVPITDDDPQGGVEPNSVPDSTDPPPPEPPLVKYADLISDIKTDYIVDHDDANAHPKWKRVLKAFGEPGYLNYHLDAMTSEEAQDLYDDNGWARWEPIGDALAYTEQYGTTTSGEPEADSQQDSQQTQQGQQQSTDQQEASEDDDALPSDHPLVVYATLIGDIHNTYIVDHDTASAHPRWKRVLKAFGHEDYMDYERPAMTSQQAQQLYADNGWPRWQPIGAALAYTEAYVP